MNDRISRGDRAFGKEDLERLTQATVEALREAELTDEIDLLHSRVFARSAGDLFETTFDRQQYSWKFKPMLELLLRHVCEIAGQDARSTEDRRTEIRWAIDAAGY
jgi:hypothetical protein